MSTLAKAHTIERPAEESVADGAAVTAWRTDADPFAGAGPVTNLSVLIGGLPGERDADVILRDLAQCRQRSRQ